MLAQAAEKAGARVCRGARVTTCRELGSQGWQVEFVLDGKRGRLQSSFLVQATGRASVVGRWQRTKRIFYDRLVGLMSFFSSSALGGGPDYQTLVEAAEDGWWHSAWLPNARLVVAYMTDADLMPSSNRHTHKHWQSRLEQAPHTYARVRGNLLEPGLRRLAANSYRRDRLTGKHWLAVGARPRHSIRCHPKAFTTPWSQECRQH